MMMMKDDKKGECERERTREKAKEIRVKTRQEEKNLIYFFYLVRFKGIDIIANFSHFVLIFIYKTKKRK